MHRKKFSHKLTDCLLAVLLPALLYTVGNFSDAWSKRLSGWLAFLLRYLYRPGLRLIRENLHVAFPEMQEAQLNKLANESLHHTIWSWTDFIRLLRHPERLPEFLDEKPFVYKAPFPQQILLCLPHLGNWELLAQAIPRLYPNCAAVAEFFPYQHLNDLLSRSRKINGLQIIPRTGAVRGVIAAARATTSIGMLIDQNLSPRHGGLFVDFFGLPAPTSPLAAILVQRYQLPIFSGACIRLPNGKFRILLERLELPPESNRQQITQAILAANEELIRKYPAQYTWLYRRWAAIPADVSPDIASRFPSYATHKKYPLYPECQTASPSENSK